MTLTEYKSSTRECFLYNHHMPSGLFQSVLQVFIEMSQFQVTVVFLRYFTAMRLFLAH